MSVREIAKQCEARDAAIEQLETRRVFTQERSLLEGSGDFTETPPPLPRRPPPVQSGPAINGQYLATASLQTPVPSKLPSTAKWVPPIPKSKSSSIVLTGMKTSRELPKITLIDLEASVDENIVACPQDRAHDSQFRDPWQDYAAIDDDIEVADVAVSRPTIDLLANAIQKTKATTENVIKNVMDAADEGLLRTRTTAETLTSKASPLGDRMTQHAEILKQDSTNILEKIDPSKRIQQATQSTRQGLSNAFQTIGEKTGTTQAFANTKADFEDILNKLSGDPGLCSKCKTLQAEVTISRESQWATPLSRIIYHADWCRMCGLILGMLCRPEFDPLRHPEVVNASVLLKLVSYQRH